MLTNFKRVLCPVQFGDKNSLAALAVAKEIYKDFQDVHKMSGITVQQEPPLAITVHPGRAAA